GASLLSRCAVSLIRWICLGCGVLLAGSATAAVGVVGCRLMAPNLVRLALQTHHRTMIPFTVCIGAILVPLADLTSRCIAPGREIPIGILTSLAGSGFFLLLLKKTLSKYRN
ncbi:MAG: iron ABC transporter permease, partial [Verrucomicrobia bacterium]|nr:iron ABC transporter permease [Verrucomicrobiota bacterium]